MSRSSKCFFQSSTPNIYIYQDHNIIVPKLRTWAPDFHEFTFACPVKTVGPMANLRTMEISQHLRCPKCKQITNGAEDYCSLRPGNQETRKSCKRCRTKIYESYKKNNAGKKRTRNPIRYPTRYEQHLRCPRCNQPTSGPDEFKNIRSGKLTKSCSACRSAACATSKKRPKAQNLPAHKKNKLNLTQQVFHHKQILACLPQETLDLVFADEKLVDSRKYRKILEPTQQIRIPVVPEHQFCITES